MALIKNVVNLPFLKSKACVVVIQRYAQYPPIYIEPIYKPEDLKTLYEEGAHIEKSFLPIKAAKFDQNNSIFRDAVLDKFVNITMKQSQKALAKSLMEKTFYNIKMIQIEKYHKASPEEKSTIEMDPLKLFHMAINNSKPLLNLTRVKRGAIMYQVPIAITDKLSEFKAIKWFIEAAKDKHRKVHFPEKLATEILDAARNEGRVVKKKQEWHKVCEANKAYAHFRWGR
ncbi:28S ribosomal protein S7, mitochondrial [Chamberlinius hualienensis]